MPTYAYKVKDSAGKKFSGSMEATNEHALIEELHQQSLLVLSVAEKKAKRAVEVDFGKLLAEGIPKIGGRVNLETLIFFTTQLSAMLLGGLPLLQSIKSLSQDTEDSRFQAILFKLESDVKEGSSFSGALEKFPHIFNKVFVSLMMAGENSGRLGEILSLLSAYLEYQYNLRKKVFQALLYPAVVVSFAIVVVLLMVIVFIPKFQAIFRGFGKDLPLPTKVLLTISNQVQEQFLVGVVVILFVWAGAYLISRTERGRFVFDQIKLHFPVLGPIIRKSTVANFSRTLSVLLSSGLPLVRALRLATDTVNNQVIARTLSDITREIEKGGSVGEGFRNCGIFPEMVVQMVSTGEKTGTIDSMILRAAEFYEKQVDSSISKLTTVLEPIIIAVVGLIVGGIMLALFLPVFKMGGLARH